MWVYVYVTELEGVPIKGLHAQRILNNDKILMISEATFVDTTHDIWCVADVNEMYKKYMDLE